MKTLRTRVTPVVLLAIIAFAIAGCSSWEKSIYKTLYANSAVIDQAFDDFNSGKIAQTTANRDLLEKAKGINNGGAAAFKLYWKTKADVTDLLGKNSITKSEYTSRLAAARQAVVDVISELPGLIAQIKALHSGSAT